MTFAIIFLCLALANLLARPSLEQIATGDTFVYFWHVGVLSRPPWAIVGLILIALWFFLHCIAKSLSSISYLTVALFAFSCAIYTLLLPLLSVEQIAHHLQTARTPSYTYHVFYQYQGITSAGCDYILVQCDSLGLMCHKLTALRDDAICLAQHAPITLHTTGQGIRLSSAGIIVFEHLPAP